eukprot:GAFH01006286.1.p2 GENE.GAFH01006286.1~~GAFH01006286.1.p2  ORF type:complete len:85 (-),score=31.24 GAFH01006286.1:47-301(-)
MWELMTRALPFEDQNPMMIPIRVVTRNERPAIPAVPAVPVPQTYLDLMAQCWLADPSARPPMSAVLERLEAMPARLSVAVSPSQ